MPLEEEIPLFLTVGFVAIILLFTICIITLWVRNKGNNTPYMMALLHLILLSTAFYFFMNAITELDYNHPMASEENSLQIGIASGFWALSMLSLLATIFQFAKIARKNNKLE